MSGDAVSTVTLTLTSAAALQAREESLGMVERAHSLVIASSSTYAEAAFILRGLAGLMKRVKDHHKPMKDAASAAHKAIVGAEGTLLQPMELARKVLESKRAEYDTKERARVEAISREMTMTAEARALEEADVFGGEVKAIAPVVVAAVLPEVAGVSKRKRWVAVVTDKAAFVAFALEKHRAGDSRFLDLLDILMPDLHAQARVDRAGMAVPGVRSEEVVSETVKAV